MKALTDFLMWPVTESGTVATGTEVLQRAIELLEQPNGWCQYGYRRKISGHWWQGNRVFAYCMTEAIKVSSSNSEEREKALQLVFKKLGTDSEDDLCRVNDYKYQTQEKIVSFLRTCLRT